MQQNSAIAVKSIKSLFKSRLTYLWLAATTLFFIIFFFARVKTNPYVIFTAGQKSPVLAYNDKFDSGNSVIHKSALTDSGQTVKFTLKKGFISPYIGVLLKEFEKVKDITPYNRLHVELEAEGPDNLLIYLITKDPNVKDTTHRLADRHSNYNLILDKQKKQYSIPIKAFSTPDWWYQIINQSKVNFGPVELDKLKRFTITTGISPATGKVQELTIKSVFFYKDYSHYILIAATFEFLLLLSLFIYHFIKIKRTVKPLEVLYKPVEEPEKVTTDEGSFFDYININYHDPELSLKKVAQSSGIQERIISKTISDKYNCNFKTYINRIRVEEARRLLKSSDLNISEVAYKVGFNSPSTFTKVFKKMTGNSPSFFTPKTKV